MVLGEERGEREERVRGGEGAAVAAMAQEGGEAREDVPRSGRRLNRGRVRVRV